MEKTNNSKELKLEIFNRNFFQSDSMISVIGGGSIGGKASGLSKISRILSNNIDNSKYPKIDISIPKTAVIASNIFDQFMEINSLYDRAYNENDDRRIIEAFLKADIPVTILGDLRSIVEQVNKPLAVRSSSILEDDREEPFAGIYATKMISNNQSSTDERFKKLVEAIKFVYASTFFKAAKDYLTATKHEFSDEKMAVIIQEVVGENRNKRFYPNMSGVSRSYNYYSFGKSKPEDGVVSLALGLGKTIVDGGITWTYAPPFPKAVPPFADPSDMMKNTQIKFWAVNMGQILNYDPTRETEYLLELNVDDADYDNSIKEIASTFNMDSGRIVPGTGNEGPRILNFAPLLVFNDYKFNDLIKDLLKICQEEYQFPVEIEFAVNIDSAAKTMRFGFLQVRPMMVSYDDIEISDEEMSSEKTLLASNKVLGNGENNEITDIVFVKPDGYDKKFNVKIASEIDMINRKLLSENRKYLLIGFGRWGSSDPWLGIPVEWGQIAGAGVIVESTLEGINVELSQGSHFFHNLTSFKVSYLSLHHESTYSIDWDWLNRQKTIDELEFVKHVKIESPLKIKVDGKTARGVILK